MQQVLERSDSSIYVQILGGLAIIDYINVYKLYIVYTCARACVCLYVRTTVVVHVTLIVLGIYCVLRLQENSFDVVLVYMKSMHESNGHCI